jgi:hypothetical protein
MTNRDKGIDDVTARDSDQRSTHRRAKASGLYGKLRVRMAVFEYGRSWDSGILATRNPMMSRPDDGKPTESSATVLVSLRELGARRFVPLA